MHRFSSIALVLLVLFSYSCNSDQVISKGVTPGIAITFDDNYVDEWYDLLPVLKKHKMKATFFADYYRNMSAEEKLKLLRIQNEGFEIGAHTEHHSDLSETADKMKLEELIRTEVLAQKSEMEHDGFIVNSFAYPHGWNTEVSDSILLGYFKMLRDVTDKQRHFYSFWFATADNTGEVFYPGKKERVVAALDLDEQTGLEISRLEEFISKAKEKGKVLVLYAHKPVKDNPGGYEVSVNYLEKLFALCNKYGLISYNFSELYDLKKIER